MGLNYGEAMQSTDKSKWEEAIELEMKTLEEMETFSEVPRSCINGDSNQFLYFKTRFVLDYKEHEKRYKVRLVVMAYNWEEGYYSEFFKELSIQRDIIMDIKLLRVFICHCYLV
jgi:hypothetical protein